MTPITYGIRVSRDTGVHVWFNLHAGPAGSRGLAGRDICLRKEEFTDFVARLGAEVRDPWYPIVKA